MEWTRKFSLVLVKLSVSWTNPSIDILITITHMQIFSQMTPLQQLSFTDQCRSIFFSGLIWTVFAHQVSHSTSPYYGCNTRYVDSIFLNLSVIGHITVCDCRCLPAGDITVCIVPKRTFLLRFSSNSEALASEILENLQEMQCFLVMDSKVWTWRNDCIEFYHKNILFLKD